jgi:hypothetical protein
MTTTADDRIQGTGVKPSTLRNRVRRKTGVSVQSRAVEDIA